MGDFGAEFIYDHAGRALLVLLVCVDFATQKVRPAVRQGKLNEFARQLLIEQFRPHRRFNAIDRFALARATVINVVVDVAVFLSFGFVLGGYHHTAGAAEQAAKGHWLSGFVLLAKTAQRNHFLHLVKQFFAHKRRMFALVLFASIHEVSVIKRIGQNLFDLIWFIYLAAFGFDATREQIVRYVLKTTFVFGI